MTKKQWKFHISNKLLLLALILLIGGVVWAKQATAATIDVMSSSSSGEAAIAGNAPQMAGNCSNTSTGLKPLSDLSRSGYFGFPGGLYSRGNDMPDQHSQIGFTAAQAVQPLDNQGNPAESGKIALLSIGMSNTSQEFNKFIKLSRGQRSDNVVLVNGAFAGHDASRAADLNSGYWDKVDNRLAGRKVTRSQVQVIWVKQAVAGETDPFPQDALELQSYLREIILIAEDRFPNLKAIYFSSRTYGGYAQNGSGSPEPWAYQGGFAIKWLVESQIDGTDPALAYDNTPWLAWGPYLWADGLNPRSDGLVWKCSDFENDGLHPSAAGELKVATWLLDFFMNDPMTEWFSNS